LLSKSVFFSWESLRKEVSIFVNRHILFCAAVLIGITQEVIKKLQGTGQKVRHAQILHKAATNGSGWTGQQIADAYACRINMVEKIRQGALSRRDLNGRWQA